MPVVWAALTPAEHVFSASGTVEDVARSLDEERNAAPVVGEHGLLGMVSLAQLQKHVAEGCGNFSQRERRTPSPVTIARFTAPGQPIRPPTKCGLVLSWPPSWQRRA
jgi:hypothetical protein